MITLVNEFLHDIITFGEQTNNLTTFIVYILSWLGIYKFIKAVDEYV